MSERDDYSESDSDCAPNQAPIVEKNDDDSDYLLKESDFNFGEIAPDDDHDQAYIDTLLAGLADADPDDATTPAAEPPQPQPQPQPEAVALDQAPATAPQPKPVDPDQVAAVEELERADQERDRAPAPSTTKLIDADEIAAVEALDQDKADQAPDHGERPDWRRVAKLAGQWKAMRKERTRQRDLEMKEAEAAAVARIRADRKRAKDTERQRRYRGSLEVRTRKRLEKLLHATANPNRDKFLEQFRGREVTMTRFSVVMDEAMQTHGDKVSGQKLADLFNDTWRGDEEPIDRFAAIRMRRHVAKLEMKGRPWS